MRKAIALMLLLLFATAVSAQTPTPPPTPPPEPNTGVTLTAGISYTLLTNGPGNSVNVTKLDVALPVTDHFSLIYNQYMIPAAQANVFLGGIRYSALLTQIVKPKASFKLDPNKFRLYADIGLGSRRDSISNVRVGVAAAVSAGFSYNPVSNVAISLEGGYIRTGRVTAPAGALGAKRDFLFGTSPMIAPGVKLTF